MADRTEADVFKLINTLPETSYIRCFTDYAQYVTDCPSLYMMHTAIQTLVCACPLTMSVQLGIPIRPNLYTLLVGPSGEVRKTTAIDWGSRMLNQSGPTDYQLIGAVSPEAIVRMLGEQPRRLIPITEGGDWLNRTRPGAYQNTMRDNFVALYDGKPIGHVTRDKKNSLKEVKEHHVSVFMGCTPQHLEEYTSTVDFKGGLMNRFLVAYVPARERTIENPVVNKEGETWLSQLLIRKLDAAHADAVMCGFSKSAGKLWTQWTRSLKAWQKQLPAHKAVVVARATTHAIKLMQIAAVDLERVQGDYLIQEDCVAFATGVVNWAIQDMLIVSENIAGNDYERRRLQVLNAFKYYEDRVEEIEPIPYSHVANVLHPRMSKRDLDGTLESMKAEGTLHTWSYSGAGELYSLHPPPLAEYTDDIF